MYGAKMRFTAAALFCLGFISVFISGGISGFFLAQPSLDTYLHATYFVVAHFHFVMAVASLFGVFAGTYFWFPKMTGRMMNETPRQMALLADLHRRVLHFHADALLGPGRECPALLGIR